MIRFLKFQKVSDKKHYIEVTIDNVAELENLKDNIIHGSVAQLIDSDRLTVYVFNEVLKRWVVK